MDGLPWCFGHTAREQAPCPPFSLQAQLRGINTAPRQPHQQGAAVQRERHGPRCWCWPPGGGGAGPAARGRPRWPRRAIQRAARLGNGRGRRRRAQSWPGAEVAVDGLPTGRWESGSRAMRALGQDGVGLPPAALATLQPPAVRTGTFLVLATRCKHPAAQTRCCTQPMSFAFWLSQT